MLDHFLSLFTSFPMGIISFLISFFSFLSFRVLSLFFIYVSCVFLFPTLVTCFTNLILPSPLPHFAMHNPSLFRSSCSFIIIPSSRCLCSSDHLQFCSLFLLLFLFPLFRFTYFSSHFASSVFYHLHSTSSSLLLLSQSFSNSLLFCFHLLFLLSQFAALILPFFVSSFFMLLSFIIILLQFIISPKTVFTSFSLPSSSPLFHLAITFPPPIISNSSRLGIISGRPGAAATPT